MSKERSIGRMFLRRIEKSGPNSAIGEIVNSQVNFITFNEYAAKVEALSLGLMKNGLNPQDRLSILASTSKKWHLLDLATMCARGVTIPIYPTYTSSEVAYIFNHAECSIIAIENSDQLEKVLESIDKLEKLRMIISFTHISKELQAKIDSKIEFTTFDSLTVQGEEEKKVNPSKFKDTISGQSGSEIASIIYTSGTTGTPKGALVTNDAFAQLFENLGSFFRGVFSKTDRSLTWLPLSHVFGRTDSMLPIIFGNQMVFAESIDKLIDNIPIVRPTMMCAVPRIFEKIYAKIMVQIENSSSIKKSIFNWANCASNRYFEAIQKDLSPSPLDILQRNLAYKLVFNKIFEKFGGRLRFFISGGAPLSPQIIKFLRNCNLNILEGYGLTETIAPCLANPASKQIPGTVGLPMGDVEIKFADDGEILIKTAAMLKEYYKNPEETAASLKDGYFYTGDIGKLNSEGYLCITDRKKDILITSAGKNVAPQKIENLMKCKKFISQFMVVGDQRKYLTGVVAIEKASFADRFDELNVGGNCTISDLAQHSKVKELIQKDINEVNHDLAQFETIKKFIVAEEEFSVENGTLTPSLKIKKKEINKRFRDRINAMY